MGFGEFAVGGLLGGMLIGLLAHDATKKYYQQFNLIPSNTEVQESYIAPSELEVVVRDQDRNGELETIMRVGESEYLLRNDADGFPILQPYAVEITTYD